MSDRKVAKVKGPDSKSKQPGPDTAPRKKRARNDVGRALRSVYDETLREEVPDDFMDLLGKLD